MKPVFFPSWWNGETHRWSSFRWIQWTKQFIDSWRGQRSAGLTGGQSAAQTEGNFFFYSFSVYETESPKISRMYRNTSSSSTWQQVTWSSSTHWPQISLQTVIDSVQTAVRRHHHHHHVNISRKNSSNWKLNIKPTNGLKNLWKNKNFMTSQHDVTSRHQSKTWGELHERWSTVPSDYGEVLKVWTCLWWNVVFQNNLKQKQMKVSCSILHVNDGPSSFSDCDSQQRNMRPHVMLCHHWRSHDICNTWCIASWDC